MRAWIRPSLADICAIALLAWLLASTFSGGPDGPLHDATTGFQIRVGQSIAASGTVPRIDSYSFTRPGEPWFAWEWLTALGMYWIWLAGGLKGILLVSCGIIALTAALLLRRMASRGPNAIVIVLLLHVVIGASSTHYLARAHILTLFFFALCIHRRPAWWMIPVSALWANLHGGFAAFIVSLGVLAVGRWLEGERVEARRTALIAASAAAASLLNPYGWHEHAHIVEYMRAGWVVQLVEEFQRPKLGTASGIYFLILACLGTASAIVLVRRRRYAEPLLILAWVLAGSNSVRHVPILAICAAPAIAEVGAAFWSRWFSSPGQWRKVFDGIARDNAPGFLKVGWALPAVLCLLSIAPLPWPGDFPASRYPVDLAHRLSGYRLFTTDYWADYLIFRNYPQQRAFIDGRCDFYGEQLTGDYITALSAKPGWQDIIDRARVNAVLVPPETPLRAALEGSPEWRRIEQTPQAELFERRVSP